MEEESQESPGVLQAPPALSRPTVYCREGADFLQIIFMLSIHNLGGGEREDVKRERMCFLLSLPFAVFFLLLFPVVKWKMGRGKAQAGFGGIFSPLLYFHC